MRVFTILGPSHSGKSTLAGALADLDGSPGKTFEVPGVARIYIDPWQLEGNPPLADLILVTHHHYDHCSSDDIGRICQASTVIVANPSAAKKLRKELGKEAVQLQNMQRQPPRLSDHTVEVKQSTENHCRC